MRPKETRTSGARAVAIASEAMDAKADVGGVAVGGADVVMASVRAHATKSANRRMAMSRQLTRLAPRAMVARSPVPAMRARAVGDVGVAGAADVAGAVSAVRLMAAKTVAKLRLR